jgi:hypothetical protein
VQQLQHRELLGRARVLAVVVARELVEAELVLARDVPQELRVERGRERGRLRQRLAGAGRRESASARWPP